MSKTARTLLPEFREGDKIGGEFEVIHTISKGGMGQIYLCYNIKEEYFYALKTFGNNQSAESYAKLRDNFQHEVDAWIRLGVHPNITRCFTVRMLDSFPFIVLEWVTDDNELARMYEEYHRDTPHFFDWYSRLGIYGLELRQHSTEITDGHKERAYEPDLESWIVNKILSPKMALSVGMDICRGLSYAYHKAGLVHRDLKPSNILLTPQGRAKITDFGTAIISGEATVESRSKGTANYKPPEQWNNSRLDIRTDLYAFGAILFEMLSGRKVFDGNNDYELRKQHVEAPAPHLDEKCLKYEGQLDRDTLRRLDYVIQQCLHKSPAERFDTPDTVFTQLSQIYEQKFTEKTAPLDKISISVEDYNYIASTHVWLAKQEEAVGNYQNAQENYDEAMKNCENAIRLDSSHPNTYNNRGIIFYYRRNYRAALKDYDQVIRLGRTFSEKGTDGLNGKTHFNAALTYFAQKRYQRALEEVEEAYECANKYVNRAVIQIALGNYDTSLEDSSKAIELDKYATLAYFNRHLVYKYFGRLEEAEADAEIGKRYNPTLAWDEIANAALINQEFMLDFAHLSEPEPSLVSSQSHIRSVLAYEFERYDPINQYVFESGHYPFSPVVLVKDVKYSSVLHKIVRSRLESGESVTQITLVCEIKRASGASQHDLARLLGFESLEEWLAHWDQPRPLMTYPVLIDQHAIGVLASPDLKTIKELVGREVELKYIDPFDALCPLRIEYVFR